MKKLENILDMLDCGIVEIMFDGDARSITWANNGFFALTGASREEYDNELKHGNPKNVLHPDDFERVFSAFHKHVQTKETLSIEYRVMHKNGSYVWLSVVSNFIGYKNNKPCFINIMKDITELKKIRSKIEYEAERYRIVCSLANDLLFEYDIENDTLINYSKNSYDFNTLRIDNFLSRPADHKMLPDDSIKVLRKFFLQEVVVARQYKKSEPFQIITKNGCQWFSVNCGIINNTIVGIFINIDKEMTTAIKLKKEIREDTMTGLLNKVAFIQDATEFLKHSSGKQGYHAMVIFDIDNFKQANDKLGHGFGDTVIQHVAMCIKETFRSEDLKGRFGGDEFVALIKDVNIPQIKQLIRRYQENLVEKNLSLKVNYSLTNSIGISLFPRDGKTFEQLFKSADIALYKAKEQGKNQASFFDSPV